MKGLKLIDCSSCIGLGNVNRMIINHEDYPVYEKVKQAASAKELLDEMDFCDIEEAIVYHQAMFDVGPDYGNNLFLLDKNNYNGRLRGTLTILPSISDKGFSPDEMLLKMQKNNIVALRAFPKWNRFLLDDVTCGDILQFMIERNIPLYLTPMFDWEHIFNALKEFPKLTVIITNYGLWGSDRYFYPLVKNYDNVYIDTSDFQVLKGIDAFVNKFGSDKMLFGTNYPCDNMGGPIATLIGSKISNKNKEKIAHENIERLLSKVNLK